MQGRQAVLISLLDPKVPWVTGETLASVTLPKVVAMKVRLRVLIDTPALCICTETLSRTGREVARRLKADMLTRSNTTCQKGKHMQYGINCCV